MNCSVKTRKCTQAGFSLIELMVSILILVIVMGVVFRQVDNIQMNAKTEALKLDLTQESREFADQFARDIHMSGFPTSRIYQNPNPGGPTDPGGQQSPVTALGLVYASGTSIRFEGDVYGDGNVYSVVYTYVAVDPDPNCPCLRRSALVKIQADPVTKQTPAKYYTEVQNVIDPTGMAQGIFTFFQADGTAVDLTPFTCVDGTTGCVDIDSNPSTIQLIDAIKVNLNTKSHEYDPRTGRRVVNNISTIAELEN